MTSHGLRKLRDGPKTLTQTSESVSDQPTNQLTGIGARDGYASKSIFNNTCLSAPTTFGRAQAIFDTLVPGSTAT